MATTILQLDPSIPVYVKDKGIGETLFLMETGKEDDTLFGVAMDDSGHFWWVPMSKIKLLNNYSIGRVYEK